MKQRTKYFDYLRVFATFAVVMLHTAGAWFSVEEIGSSEWLISLLYDSATRFAVPIFAMISGAVFLGRDIDTKKIYTRYILRIVTAFIFWSFIYAVVTDPTANIKGMVVNVLYGHYHMWFLYMIIGLYILVPILRKVVETKEVTKYFLGLAIVFAVLIPQMVELTDILPQPIQLLGEIADTVVGKININLFAGFVGYFVAGYYLNNVAISHKWRRIIYVLGCIGYVATVVFTAVLCVVQNKANEMFFGSFTFNIVLYAVAIFVFGKYELEESKILGKVSRGIEKMAQCSFGAYLVHALILNKIMGLLNFSATTLNIIILIPVISIIVFVVSMGISALIKQIPILKKYIV